MAGELEIHKVFSPVYPASKIKREKREGRDKHQKGFDKHLQQEEAEKDRRDPMKGSEFVEVSDTSWRNDGNVNSAVDENRNADVMKKNDKDSIRKVIDIHI